MRESTARWTRSCADGQWNREEPTPRRLRRCSPEAGVRVSPQRDAMSDSTRKRVLIVANRTAATPGLLHAVRRRVREGPCSFALLVPQFTGDEQFGEVEARKTLELAIPLLEEASGGRVTGMIGPTDAFLAVERVLVHEHFDEVIISTLPQRVSHWLKRDLPARVERLGIPVTVVRAKAAAQPVRKPFEFAGP